MMWSHGCERFSLGQSPTFPSNYNPLLDLQSEMLEYNPLHAAVISIPLKMAAKKLAFKLAGITVLQFERGFSFLFLNQSFFCLFLINNRCSTEQCGV